MGPPEFRGHDDVLEPEKLDGVEVENTTALSVADAIQVHVSKPSM